MGKTKKVEWGCRGSQPEKGRASGWRKQGKARSHKKQGEYRLGHPPKKRVQKKKYYQRGRVASRGKNGKPEINPPPGRKKAESKSQKTRT